MTAKELISILSNAPDDWSVSVDFHVTGQHGIGSDAVTELEISEVCALYFEKRMVIEVARP